MSTYSSHREKRTLLVPLDGTEFSRQILDQVRTLFAPDRFRIALLHVVKPPTNFSPPYWPAVVGPDYTLYAYGAGGYDLDDWDRAAHQRHALYEGDAYEEYLKRLEQELERELTLFRGEGYDASATVHFGDPVQEILTFAQNEAIAAIAMATHGRTGLGRLLQGSVAQDVFTRLDKPIPVLLLRPENTTAAEPMTTDARRHDGAAGDAVLAERPGTGSLVISRDADGTFHEATGSFTPRDTAVDLAPLREMQRENLPVTYDGPIIDPDTGRERRRRTRVMITRILEHPPERTAGEPAEHIVIDFTAIEVADGELVTKRSTRRKRDKPATP